MVHQDLQEQLVQLVPQEQMDAMVHQALMVKMEPTVPMEEMEHLGLLELMDVMV
jgi:hypothetical protein